MRIMGETTVNSEIRKYEPIVPILNSKTEKYLETSAGYTAKVYTLDGVDYVSFPLKFNTEVPLTLVTARGEPNEETATIDTELHLSKTHFCLGDSTISFLHNIDIFKESKDGVSVKLEFNEDFHDSLAISPKNPLTIFQIGEGCNRIDVRWTIKGEVRLDTGIAFVKVENMSAVTDKGVDVTKYFKPVGYRLDGAKIISLQ